MGDYFKKEKRFKFSSPLSLGLLKANPFARTPVEAILFQVEMLLIESGMTEPPFRPTVYAPLRNVKKVLYRDMKVEGRLIPHNDGFIIELRKDRPFERTNFTFAHELAHTFFYECVPLIKYRPSEHGGHGHDEEEERLCNIAASELLMPKKAFLEVTKDFSPSPQSLQKISEIFETSLTATLIKILNMNLWSASFVLWTEKNGKIEAKWFATSKRGVQYDPDFDVVNFKTTSLYHTLITGKSTSASEWFSIDNQYKFTHCQSVRLNSKTVLSCFTRKLNKDAKSTFSKDITSQKLPLAHECKCDGKGWYYLTRDGTNYVANCKAASHIKPIYHKV